MRATQVVAGLATVVTAVLGLSFATAGSAAADTGAWHAFGNTNPITSSPSTWRCTPSVPVDTTADGDPTGPGVIAQVCAIRSSDGGSVQGAVIVRNNRSNTFPASALVQVTSENGQTMVGDWSCAESGVAANSWSVCFGATSAKSFLVVSNGFANSTFLNTSSPGI